MQQTSRYRETIDACRFCWMCRHICPIGNATGQERNTARARALVLSFVARNCEKLENIVDNIYECALCGACTRECMTGWDPVSVTTEARLNAALDGILPDSILQLIDRIEKTGNVFGETQIDSALVSIIDTLPKMADTLFLIGRNAMFRAPKTAREAIHLLKKTGIQFTATVAEPDSGYALYFLTGATEETRTVMQKAAEFFNRYKTIIVFDPLDASLLNRQYREWGIPVTAKIITATSFLADLVKQGILQPKKGNGIYTFQDPAALARDLEETEAARTVLESCGTLREMFLNRRDTMIAGHLVMAEYLPDVILAAAANRINSAMTVEAKTVVTACPSDYVAIKAVCPNSIQVKSLEKVVLECLQD
ncbi:MAG: (Fe-S)-binding protein [Planctomycetia bacterium]|nr:(Fe-S)-binding protein [Planctomycetia bacterium]